MLSAAVVPVASLGVPAAAAAAPDLSLAARDSPDPATVGLPLTYSLTLSNLGADPAIGTTLQISVPEASDLITVTPSRGGCDAGRTTTCALGTIEPAGAVSVTVSVRPTAPGLLTMTAQAATAGTAELNTANNSVVIATDVRLRPGACANQRIGTSFADVLDGTVGGDSIFGHSGNDFVRGGAGDDCLLGAAGNDRLDGGPGADALSGDEGRDALAGSSGRDHLLGRSGEDFLFGGSGADFLSGGGGHDELSGNGQGDRLDGGGSPDSISGGSGRDRLRGGSGADVLLGGAGVDRLSGGSGGDLLGGGDGRDRVAGGPGADAIYAAERVDAGSGDDEVYVRPGARVRCGAGDDTLFVAGSPKLAGNGDCERFLLDAGELFPTDSPEELLVSFECAFGLRRVCDRRRSGSGQIRRRKPRRFRGRCRRRRCRPLVVQQRVEPTVGISRRSAP